MPIVVRVMTNELRMICYIGNKHQSTSEILGCPLCAPQNWWFTQAGGGGDGNQPRKDEQASLFCWRDTWNGKRNETPMVWLAGAWLVGHWLVELSFKGLHGNGFMPWLNFSRNCPCILEVVNHSGLVIYLPQFFLRVLVFGWSTRWRKSHASWVLMISSCDMDAASSDQLLATAVWIDSSRGSPGAASRVEIPCWRCWLATLLG